MEDFLYWIGGANYAANSKKSRPVNLGDRLDFDRDNAYSDPEKFEETINNVMAILN